MSYVSEDITTGAEREPGHAVRARGEEYERGMALPKETYVIAMAGSIALSAWLFLSGRRDWGIFVGLWAPTFLNLGLYNKLIQKGEKGRIHTHSSQAYGQV